MKPYIKPKLVALSLSGNERLCGDCSKNNAELLYQDPELATQILQFFAVGEDLSADGVTRDDFKVVFDDSSCSTPVIGFCKFTASDTLVAWS